MPMALTRRPSSGVPVDDVTMPETVPVGFGMTLPPTIGRPWRAAQPALNINTTHGSASVRNPISPTPAADLKVRIYVRYGRTRRSASCVGRCNGSASRKERGGGVPVDGRDKLRTSAVYHAHLDRRARRAPRR